VFASCSSYVRIFFKRNIFSIEGCIIQLGVLAGKCFENFLWETWYIHFSILIGAIKSRAGIPVKTFLVTERNKQTKKELTRNVTPNITDNLYFQNVNRINSAYEPSSPSGRRITCDQAFYIFFPRRRFFLPPRKNNECLIRSFCSMKRLGVFLFPPEWDASPSQGYPQHSIRRYPLWVKRGTVGVKYLTQGHNTMSPTSARTQTAQARGDNEGFGKF